MDRAELTPIMIEQRVVFGSKPDMIGTRRKVPNDRKWNQKSYSSKSDMKQQSYHQMILVFVMF